MNRNILLEFKLGKRRTINVQIIHLPEDRMTACLIVADRDIENQCYGGIAYRNPADADDPKLGMRLALRRALRTAWNLTTAERKIISHTIREALASETKTGITTIINTPAVITAKMDRGEDGK